MPTNVRDPRTIVTPDAFEIDAALLGLPLAPPWRRFWAMMVDLAAVGVLTAVLSSVQLLLWTVIGLLLVRLALKKTGRSVSQAAGLVLRVAVGCLGTTILGVVLLVFALVRLSNDGDMERMVTSRVEGAMADRVARAAAEGDGETIRSLSDVDMADADDAEEALELFGDMLEGLEAAPLPRSVKRQILVASVPPTVPWHAQADSLARLAMDRFGESDAARTGDSGSAAGQAAASESRSADPVGRAAGQAAASDPRAADSAGLADDEPAGPAAGEEALAVEAMTPEAVARQFAALVEGDADAGDPRYQALRARLVTLVAADTLAALSAALEAESEAREARAGPDEGGSGAAAFAELMRDVWDQLGSAIGLWSIYFTVLLTLWNGQTGGKRLMGVRVVRLDGLPIGWWPAFERAGGYVAGLATGLLGFAQVFWDPNRQCIHDKIVGTVVIDERAERVPGAWQEAWAASQPPPRNNTEP